MRVALTVRDHIDRAALVYGDRVAIVDEPDQPAESWGEVTYARVAELARAQAAALDRLGVGHGERVAIVSQNSARLLTAFFGVSAVHGSLWMIDRALIPVNTRNEQHKEVGFRLGCRKFACDFRSRHLRSCRNDSDAFRTSHSQYSTYWAKSQQQSLNENLS
jgi:acyl-CoA synthetase (AMP-forming)/AMP-acid ligase II